MSKDCELCKKPVKDGEGVTIITDGIIANTRFHQPCFDEMWEKSDPDAEPCEECEEDLRSCQDIMKYAVNKLDYALKSPINTEDIVGQLIKYLQSKIKEEK